MPLTFRPHFRDAFHSAREDQPVESYKPPKCRHAKFVQSCSTGLEDVIAYKDASVELRSDTVVILT